MEQFLQTLREVVSEIEDTKERLQLLEELFRGFERVQTTTSKELKTLRDALQREEAAAAQIRSMKAEVELVGRAVIKAWLRTLQNNGSELLEEEYKTLVRAERLGWVKMEDFPTRP